MVLEYASIRRHEIRIEAGREPTATFIPQDHLPGREAEVDFGEVAVRLLGEWVACALFCTHAAPTPRTRTGSRRTCRPLNAGALTTDAVALEARKHDDSAADLVIEPSAGPTVAPRFDR